jgi:hypothetical protein
MQDLRPYVDLWQAARRTEQNSTVAVA